MEKLKLFYNELFGRPCMCVLRTCTCDMRNDDEGDMNTIIDIIIKFVIAVDTTRRL